MNSFFATSKSPCTSIYCYCCPSRSFSHLSLKGKLLCLIPFFKDTPVYGKDNNSPNMVTEHVSEVDTFNDQIKMCFPCVSFAFSLELMYLILIVIPCMYNYGNVASKVKCTWLIFNPKFACANFYTSWFSFLLHWIHRDYDSLMSFFWIIGTLIETMKKNVCNQNISMLSKRFHQSNVGSNYQSCDDHKSCDQYNVPYMGGRSRPPSLFSIGHNSLMSSASLTQCLSLWSSVVSILTSSISISYLEALQCS